jgi:hypothetical protein
MSGLVQMTIFPTTIVGAPPELHLPRYWLFVPDAPP